VVRGLQKRGLRVAGVISRGVDQEGKRLGYQLVNIQSAEMCILASVEPKTDWARFRRFYFNPEAIDRGCSWLEQGLLKGVDLLVIDEVGPMELQGGGWSRVLDKIVTMEAPVCQLWVVRERILASVMERWSLDDAQIMQQDQWTSENIIEYMLHKMKTYE
jgi:nucleoside-triphosphatase THEP1